MNTSRFVFNKTTPQNTVRPLKDYLDGQKEILEKLEKVIQAEYESLKDRHLENLKPLSEMKSDLMLKLQSNDQRIKLHPDVAKLHTEFLPEVTIIKNMMKKCQFRNEINGKHLSIQIAFITFKICLKGNPVILKRRACAKVCNTVVKSAVYIASNVVNALLYGIFPIGIGYVDRRITYD